MRSQWLNQSGELQALPFGRLAALDEETDEALKRLSKARNFQSHGQGPKGGQVPESFEKCRDDLEIFLAGIEFVAYFGSSKERDRTPF